MCIPIPPQNLECPREDSNLHTEWQLILSQPCLPLHHVGIHYSEQDLHLQSIPATGLKPVVYSNFHHQSIKARKDGLEPSKLDFQSSALPVRLLPHKKQVTGFEPVIFGLEDRRDKPTTLNLHISCHARTRTRN